MTKRNIMKIICSLVYITITIVNAAHLMKLPQGFIQCKKSDPKFDECLTNAFQKSIPHLAKGIPSLTMYKLDPFRISELQIDQGEGPVSIKLNFKELDIHNLRNLHVKKVHYDPVNFNADLEFQISIPITLDGDYDITGKVLVLPIVGKGKSKIDIFMSNITAKVQFKPIVKNGNTYLDMTKFDWKFVVKNMNIKLTNLFNGDKALGDNMNLFLNENWRDVLNELLPSIEKVFGIAFKDAGQQFFKNIPENQIFYA
ncbi:Haemolymph juvenile hormone binding [Cinara cedri]|uniref:Haemolymph juvenile hormone binding n=1 Tax=Cinara cedri TaxID=506608 RepID=A0A5E4M2P2_9HEMI|nr:Haemolymph juvenile hormone binding [Cinara cedri]